jgi:hypothetical protein
VSADGSGEMTQVGDSLISLPSSQDMGRIIGTKTPAAPVAQSAPAASVATTEPAAQSHQYDFSKLGIAEHEAADYTNYGNYMHERGHSQEAVSDAAAYLRESNARQAKEYEANSEVTYATLQKRWGTELDANLSIARTFISGQPSALQPGLRMLADISPDWCQQLVNWGKQAPIDVAEPRPAGADELGKLKVMMSNPRSPYWHGEESERLQARFRELVGGDKQVQPQNEGREGRYVRGDTRRSVPS